jgi:elongation factor G
LGEEDGFDGMVDLLTMKAFKFEGEKGKNVSTYDCPADKVEEAKKYRAMLVEKIVETDDAAMSAYLEGTEPSVPELKAILRRAVIANKIFPTFCGSALKNRGVQLVLDGVVDYLPSPLDLPPAKGVNPDTGEAITRSADDKEPFSALIFKLQVDPFVGQLSFFRVYSGTFTAGNSVYNATTGKKERVGRIVRLQANKREEIKTVFTGEIAALVGVKESKIGHTICDEDKPIILEEIEFREPVLRARIEPKTKGDQEKMGMALNKLSDEDPTFRVSSDEETGDTIVAGMGELHLEIMVDRMKREFGVEATLGKPQVAYRETITGSADVENKYIKQTGGRGQYGHVKIKMKRLEPLVEGEKIKNNVKREDHFEFTNNIKGGVIPQEFIPAVEKGIREAMTRGIQAGYPVVDIAVELYDGSYHDVDSSEIAFKIAASQAFQEAARQSKPVLLEPVMKVVVVTPDKFMGDITGNFNSKRGQIQSIDDRSGGLKVISAFVPLSEMFGYTTTLRSMTEGRANNTMTFDHYEVVPKNVADEVIASRK